VREEGEGGVGEVGGEGGDPAVGGVSGRESGVGRGRTDLVFGHSFLR